MGFEGLVSFHFFVGFLGFWVFGFLGFLGFGAFGLLGFWVLGFFVFAFQGFRVVGFMVLSFEVETESWLSRFGGAWGVRVMVQGLNPKTRKP